MTILRSLAVVLLLLTCSLCEAQSSFDTTTIYYQRRQLADLYNDLMDHVSSIKIIDSLSGGPVPSPRKNQFGEATFVYEVSDDGTLENVYITEYWSIDIDRVSGDCQVGDRIVFVDGEQKGFDLEKVKESKFSRSSKEVILYLMEYQWANSKFKVIKPRERNLKYRRVRFE